MGKFELLKYDPMRKIGEMFERVRVDGSKIPHHIYNFMGSPKTVDALIYKRKTPHVVGLVPMM